MRLTNDGLMFSDLAKSSIEAWVSALLRAGASPQLGSMFLNYLAINVPPLDHTAVSGF